MLSTQLPTHREQLASGVAQAADRPNQDGLESKDTERGGQAEGCVSTDSAHRQAAPRPEYDGGIQSR